MVDFDEGSDVFQSVGLPVQGGGVEESFDSVTLKL